MKSFFRFCVLGLVAIGIAFLTNGSFPSASHSKETQPIVVAAAGDYAEQVQAGVDYFKQQAEEQLPLVEKLLVSLQAGDVEAAREAYVEARPPYEQIEVLALDFEQEDADIDARPYAFDAGEKDEAFKGFHRIEALIYRDNDLEAAVPYGKELVQSIQSLIGKLNDPSNFNVNDHFEGMIGLATEIPAKKISSEEETWSDQSVLIFQNNWIGIYSQYEPFAEMVRAKNADLADRVERSYQDCLQTIEPFVTEGQAATVPYSSLDAAQRGKIVKASYVFRDALIQARAALGVGEA